MNTCPVYRRSGGLSYGSTYMGPIGIILMPTFDVRRYSELPFSSTLNGSCTNVCPVKINIHEQIYAWREVMEEKNQINLVKKTAMIVAGKVLNSPTLYHLAGDVRNHLEGAAPLCDLQSTQCVGSAAGYSPTDTGTLPRLVQASERKKRKGDGQMNFRDTILENVRKNQPSARELPTIPKFHSGQPVDLKKQFTAALKELYGEVIPEPPADFQAFLKERFPDAKTICSAVPEYTGNSKPEDFPRWSDASRLTSRWCVPPRGGGNWLSPAFGR